MDHGMDMRTAAEAVTSVAQLPIRFLPLEELCHCTFSNHKLLGCPSNMRLVATRRRWSVQAESSSRAHRVAYLQRETDCLFNFCTSKHALELIGRKKYHCLLNFLSSSFRHSRTIREATNVDTPNKRLDALSPIMRV